MTVSIQFQFQHAEFTAALERLTLTPARVTGLMRAIGVGLQHTTMQRFETATTPVGSHWQALNPAYAAVKRGPGILRVAGMRGGLQGSITFATSGASVTIGSNKIYAGVHQFGAVIRPKKGKALVFRMGGGLVFARQVRIPPRPYLGFGAEDELVVLDALDVLLPGGR